MTNQTPYLSVVATARNDNHGGNFLERMQLFVNGLLGQCRRHNLPAELVIAEWNPLPDRPRLAEALTWPTKDSPCAVRILEVPNAIHRRYPHGSKLPVYQMIGKNVAIRRARGEFILATNVDLLFSDELMAFIAQRKLLPDAMYRMDRIDVPEHVPALASLDEQLEYCRRNVIRVHRANGIYDPKMAYSTSFASRAKREASRMIREFKTQMKTATWKKWIWDVLRSPLFLPAYFLGPLWVYVAGPGYPPLHLGAPGDFTLMARSVWFALHGHAELDIFSLNLDNLAIHAAHQAGAKEIVLGDPMCIYHIEHGSGWTPEGEAQLNARLEAAGIPYISFNQFRRMARQMNRERKPLILADENWGLAQII